MYHDVSDPLVLICFASLGRALLFHASSAWTSGDTVLDKDDKGLQHLQEDMDIYIYGIILLYMDGSCPIIDYDSDQGFWLEENLFILGFNLAA
jgi:hypothetical protein